MKFLFDQNISFRILRILPSVFSDSTHVKSLGLINSSDRDIWQYAKENDYVIVSQDSDFNDMNLLLGYPPKIIWIRTGNIRTKELVQLLLKNKEEILAFLEDKDYGCFEIFNIPKTFKK